MKGFLFTFAQVLYPFKTPRLFQILFPGMVWKMPDEYLYLTFDDGPHQRVTNWVLDVLKQHQIKATFFTVGENVVTESETAGRIVQEGHSLANHTYNHLNGWKHSVEAYIENVKKADKHIPSKLFRPPYGRIKRKQRKALSEYKVIQWSLLSGDFDTALNKEKALLKLKKHVERGSIIVFHDSEKAEENLKFLLPQFIEYCLEKGYQFKPL